MPASNIRPASDPARAIYDAWKAEAAHRNGRQPAVWLKAERAAVWSAARDYALQHGVRAPSLAQVMKREVIARRHLDFGSTWASSVARLLTDAQQAALADRTQTLNQSD